MSTAKEEALKVISGALGIHTGWINVSGKMIIKLAVELGSRRAYDDKFEMAWRYAEANPNVMKSAGRILRNERLIKKHAMIILLNQ